MQLEFVDPYYIYIGLSISVKWKKDATFRTPEQIKALVRSTVIDYFDNTLEKFGADFAYSKLTALITKIDPAIDSCDITSTLRGDVDPVFGAPTPTTFKFRNKIVPGSFVTTLFYTAINGEYVPVYVKDDSNGNLTLISYGDDKELSTYGSIDYDTGTVTYTSLYVTDVIANSFKVTQYATPVNRDIDVPNNTFISLDRATVAASIGRREGFPEVTLIGV